MLNVNIENFNEVEKIHRFNHIEFYEILLSYYLKRKKIVNGEYKYCMPISDLVKMIRKHLWCFDYVRVECSIEKEDENDIGIAGNYQSKIFNKRKKPITLSVVHYDNGDGGYWINKHSISIIADEIYDTIEHELRHMMQDSKSKGKAFNQKSVEYLSKHYEIDAFSINAIRQMKRSMYRDEIDIKDAINGNNFQYVINMYRNEANPISVRKLLKKVYKGIQNVGY
jgi:hypothetical protein